MKTNTSPISIELNTQSMVFFPGQVLRGSINWNAEMRGGSIVLRLGWFIESRDVCDSMCHSSARYDATLAQGSHPFTLTLPLGPLSMDGQLFSVKWLLEARTASESQCYQLPIALKNQS